jgi:hypothetical protein
MIGCIDDVTNGSLLHANTWFVTEFFNVLFAELHSQASDEK